ncbi:tyrosine-type recombinase/integrase [Vibrio hangzhouensis]|uniref:Phage integrase family protein n=1 Tax=Vibrio hangzhouensis TaxID=462991 RepID=A0A1H5RNA8_9VIBR|nr:tyrosine-type recombinase/integrase [Vibrio hangzhouensis]SEF39218.1 Phage integrase family protein [Vibrio hangzhouensis]
MKKDVPKVTNHKQISRFSALLKNSINAAEFDEMTSGYYSKSSNLAMSKDWRIFNDFCVTKNRKSLPASVATVKEFISHERANRKYSSLKRYTVTISLVHYLFDFKDPVKNREIGLLLQDIQVSTMDKVKQTVPLSEHHLEQLNAKLQSSQDIKDIRDLAIYHVMFECALKRNELKRLEINSVRIDDDICILSIDESHYRLSETAKNALCRWLAITPYSVLFSAIDRHGNISANVLNDSSVYRVLRRASDLLALPAQLSFSSQSGRVGAVQKLSNEGYRIKEIQDFGRWASPAMPLQYSGNRQSAEKEKSKFKDDNKYD